MEMIQIPEKELNELLIKAEKWDKLHDAVGEFYQDEEEDEDSMGLLAIGEIAASHLGFMV